MVLSPAQPSSKPLVSTNCLSRELVGRLMVQYYIPELEFDEIGDVWGLPSLHPIHSFAVFLSKSAACWMAFAQAWGAQPVVIIILVTLPLHTPIPNSARFWDGLKGWVNL
ncbi:hypothetical protein (Partial), partial [Seminavis robusta]|eukprot:Sro4687_g354470.1 n/a (109) ;mRNA; r:2-328